MELFCYVSPWTPFLKWMLYVYGPQDGAGDTRHESLGTDFPRVGRVAAVAWGGSEGKKKGQY